MKCSEAVSVIVHTSVSDGICEATYASPATIRKAIAYERRAGKRSSLITGLECELRRRANSGKRVA